MANRRRPYLAAVVLLLSIALVAAACGPTATEETSPGAEAQPSLTATAPPRGKCGDGVCDEKEQEDPRLCPQDCPAPDVDEGEAEEPEPAPPGSDEGEGDEPGEPPAPPAPTATPTATPVASAGPGRALMKLQWRSSFGCCAPARQVDDVYAELEFSLELTEDGGLTGSGEGTMRSEAVARCDDTDYGGFRTANPFPVTVAGTPTTSGWIVQVTATDESEAYLVDGTVYYRQCTLCWVLPEFEGLGVTGTIADGFSMPWDLRPGDTFRFEMDYHIAQEGCPNTNDHVGEGTLEILQVPG